MALNALKFKANKHILLLLVWVAIAALLRFTNLSSKPPWSDEFATLVFSLGNGFRSIPLDEAIAPDTLLAPLKPNALATINDVIHSLMSESNHPPTYFALNHLWITLFPTKGEFVSLWVGRSLSALCGVLSIPAIFGFSFLAFRSVYIAQLSAAFMAVSPYGIYLSQEARHYTLAILSIIASLTCLIIAARTITNNFRFPWWLVATWVSVNSLGLSVHYFFILVLAGELMVAFALWSGYRWRFYKHLWRLYITLAGTFIGTLVWLPLWQNIPGSQLTSWVEESYSLSNILEPIARLFAWTVTMLFVLPLEGQGLPVILISGTLLLILTSLAVRVAIRGGKRCQSESRLPLQVLGGFVVSAIAVILGIAYGFGIDLTIAARYQFVYFPVAIALISACFACSYSPSVKQKFYRQLIAFIWLMSFLGGLTVISNLSYQKSDRPDLVIADILAQVNTQSQPIPTLIATVHKTHEQTGEMMGLAREVHQSDLPDNSQFYFLLAHKDSDDSIASQTLEKTIEQFPKPLDIWVVNFSASVDIKSQGCRKDKESIARVAGYRYRRYACN